MPSFQPTFVFDIVTTSIAYKNIVGNVVGSTLGASTYNVYYKAETTIGVFKTPDFLTPDGVISSGSPNLSLPNVLLPNDSNGDILEDTYTLTLFIENTATPGVYQEIVCSEDIKILKQGLDSCVLKGNIKFDIDCNCGKITVTDTTDYKGSDLLSKEMSFVYPSIPNVATPADLVNTQIEPTVIVAPIEYSNVTYTVNLETVYENSYGDCIIVREDLISTSSQEVVCDTNLCKLITCISKKHEEIVALAAKKGGYSALPSKMLNDFATLNIYLNEYKVYVDCGKTEEAYDTFKKIEKLIDCDCGCAQGTAKTPQVIIPLCGVSGAVTSIGGSAPVIVNQVGSGATISLDPAFVADVYSALQDISTTTSDFITISSPSPTERQVDFDQTPLEWDAWNEGLAPNATFNMSFSVPYPLRWSSNTIRNQIRIDGSFRYNGFSPGIALCIVDNAAAIPIETTRIGLPIPAFNNSGDCVGLVQLLIAGSSRQIAFIHNSNYVQDEVVNVNGIFNID